MCLALHFKAYEGLISNGCILSFTTHTTSIIPFLQIESPGSHCWLYATINMHSLGRKNEKFSSKTNQIEMKQKQKKWRTPGRHSNAGKLCQYLLTLWKKRVLLNDELHVETSASYLILLMAEQMVQHQLLPLTQPAEWQGDSLLCSSHSQETKLFFKANAAVPCQTRSCSTQEKHV